MNPTEELARRREHTAAVRKHCARLTEIEQDLEVKQTANPHARWAWGLDQVRDEIERAAGWLDSRDVYASDLAMRTYDEACHSAKAAALRAAERPRDQEAAFDASQAHVAMLDAGDVAFKDSYQPYRAPLYPAPAFASSHTLDVVEHAPGLIDYLEHGLSRGRAYDVVRIVARVRDFSPDQYFYALATEADPRFCRPPVSGVPRSITQQVCELALQLRWEIWSRSQARHDVSVWNLGAARLLDDLMAELPSDAAALHAAETDDAAE